MSASPRLLSLDVFRGATVVLMILVNNPGSWKHLYPPLAHAAWHGWTLTDLVFPFFLFAVGNALALTSPRANAAGTPFWPKWARRTLLIFGLGLLLNAAPFFRWTDAGELVPRSWETLRIMGVLQRIALAWAAAAVIVHWGGMRAACVTSAVLLLGYWAACVMLGRPGDSYSLEGFFGTHWDRQLLGAAHLYQGEGAPFDPEGLASTGPAIAQVLLGYLAGRALMPGPQGQPASLWRLWAWAALAWALAAAWEPWVPINKKLWTPSYVLLTTGLAVAWLALLAAALDRRGWRGPVVRFFEVHGQNALFLFVLSGLVPRLWLLLKGPPAPAGVGGVAASGAAGSAGGFKAALETLLGDPRALSLAVALVHVAAYGLVAGSLARRRIFIRV